MLVWLLSFTLVVAGASLPAPLMRFQEARDNLRSGRVEASVFGGPRIVGMPFHRLGMEVARNGDRLLHYRGDDEGVLGRDVFGYPVIVGGAKTLIQGDRVWLKKESSTGAELAPRGTYNFGGEIYFWGNLDLRTIGMAPTWDALEGQAVTGVLRTYLRDATGFDVQRTGSIYEVTAHFANGNEVTYEIDEARGWNATRIGGVDHRGTWSCDVELAQANGAWFPTRALLRRGDEVLTEWVVSEARFNAPDDPAGFTPEAVGLETAMQVDIRGRPSAQNETMHWDGEKVVSGSEIKRRLAAGDLQRGPTLVDSADGFDAWEPLRVRCQVSAGVLRSWVSAWEYYVVTFCKRYQLEPEQIQSAYRCLRAARDRADNYIRRSAPEFQQLQDRYASGKMTSRDAKKKMIELREPVEEIFEKNLKPCLEKIPTRAQSEQAEQRRKEGAPEWKEEPAPYPWHKEP